MMVTSSLPIIATDELGMVALRVDEGQAADAGHVAADTETVSVKRRKKSRQSQPRKNVSRHFQSLQSNGATITPPLTPFKPLPRLRRKQEPSKPEPLSHANVLPRIINGLNIDDLSSDSSLTDVPEDIGPDPFAPPAQVVALKTKKLKCPTKSRYWPHPHKSRPHFLSCLPFPPLSAERFGIMQERLSHDPFRLLIATIFLNKTPGARAMPVFYTLMERYPTPKALAEAEVQDVTEIIRVLGFQNQRARKCVEMAKMWVQALPTRGIRYRKLDYPVRRDGRDIKEGEPVDDDDGRAAWEISHLPGVGAYAHDSWRMFCRDRLRQVATGWNGEGAAELCKPSVKAEPVKEEAVKPESGTEVESEQAEEAEPFEPEWKRVLPTDKELRAWMTWMWLKEGWVWNKETGERTRASDELMEMARGGGIVKEVVDGAELIVSAANENAVPLERPTGVFGAG